jgi:flagellar biosynthesis/type III secretory pathway protein FliH
MTENIVDDIGAKKRYELKRRIISLSVSIEEYKQAEKKAIEHHSTLGQEFLLKIDKSARENGFKQGYDKGFKEGQEQGFKGGKSEGYKQGYKDGFKEAQTKFENSGYQEGYNKGMKEGKDQGYRDGNNAGYKNGYRDAVSEIKNKVNDYLNERNKLDLIGYDKKAVNKFIGDL